MVQYSIRATRHRHDVHLERVYSDSCDQRSTVSVPLPHSLTHIAELRAELRGLTSVVAAPLTVPRASPSGQATEDDWRAERKRAGVRGECVE